MDLKLRYDVEGYDVTAQEAIERMIRVDLKLQYDVEGYDVTA